MSLYLTLAWRYLRGRMVRTALTTLAIIFGVMIIFGMNGIVPAVRASFDEGVRVSAHEVDLVILPTTDRAFDLALADVVRDTPGVALVTAVLERPLRLPAAYQLATHDGRPIDALVVSGWEPDTSRAVTPFRTIAGRWLEQGERDTALVRETLLARTGLALGDRVQLPSARGTATFEIVGILPERPLFGDEEIYIPLPSAQELFNLPGQINAISGQIAPGADEAAVRANVAQRLGVGFTLGAVEAGEQEWAAVLRIAEVVFTLFGALALAMGAFIMFNTFRTSVAERRRDIGMLRAVGASRRAILGLVLTEGLLLGLFGTAVGMLAGFLVVQTLLPLLNPTWERYFGAPLGAPAFGWHIYALTIGLGLGAPLLSGLQPALAASRVSPLDALRQVVEEGGGRVARRQLALGAGMIVCALAGLLAGQAALVIIGALLFLGGLAVLSGALVQPIASLISRVVVAADPGVGHLAQRNLSRQPGRAAVTVSAVMLSMAILVALAGLATTFTGGLMGYLEQSMRADYLLLPEALVLGQGNVEAGPELAQRLRDIPGIAAATTLRRAEGQIAGASVQLIGIDPATYPQLAGLVFSSGDPARAYAQLAEGRTIIVNGVLASQQGLAVGQPLVVQTASGPQSYQLVGIGVDYLNSRVATAYIAQANLAQDFGATGDALLMADRAADAAPADVEAALVALTRDYPAFALLSYERWRASQLAANQTRTNILYALMAFLAVPALLALANTLAINVLERTREIAVLRAIGGTRAQVRRMILAESLLLALIGTLFGSLGGVWLGYALVDALSTAGLPFAYVFPGLGIALAVVVGLLFGVLAAVLPARHAARLNVVVALRYE